MVYSGATQFTTTVGYGWAKVYTVYEIFISMYININGFYALITLVY